MARRYEADRSLHAHMDAELAKLGERMAAQFKELQLTMRGSLDHLGRSINEINVALTEEREQRRADIDHVGSSLCARLDESVAAVEDERFARLEQERESLKRCAPIPNEWNQTNQNNVSVMSPFAVHYTTEYLWDRSIARKVYSILTNIYCLSASTYKYQSK